MRLKFEHAQATRDTADPVLVILHAEAPYADGRGVGETLAREYVTGETAATVAEDLVEHFAPRLLEFRCTSFAEAVEFADELPALLDGRIVNAARAAVELAVLDLAGCVFRRRAAEAVRYLELPGFGPPGCLSRVRYSGVVVGRSASRLGWLLRLQRAYGLRDFKLKVAVDGWEKRLERAARGLGSALRDGRATLRVDANGGWSPAQAAEALPLLDRWGVCAVEQPLAVTRDEDLPALARRTRCAIIADESLVTAESAESLLEAGVGVLNIRIAKLGGLLAAWRIAAQALAAGADVQLGCLVGETSVLSAAGIAFLEACPRVRFAEGCFGRFLLREDVVRKPIQFGLGGRVLPRRGDGLGVAVDPGRLARLTSEELKIRF